MSESCFYHISLAGKLARVATDDAALAAAKDGGFVWLHYCQTTKEELSHLVDPWVCIRFLSRIVLTKTRFPRLKTFLEIPLLSSTPLTIQIENFRSARSICLSAPTFWLPSANAIPKIAFIWMAFSTSWEKNIESARHGPSFLMHVILDYVVDQKFVTIEALEDELDAVEGAMLADASSFKPRRADTIPSLPVESPQESFPRAGDPHQDLSQRLSLHSGKGNLPLSRHLRPSCEILRVDRVLPGYSHQSHGNVPVDAEQPDDQSRNETNVTVRRLTFITTIFMPLTLLAGIGGMSEWSMMTGPENWRIAYPAFLLAMVVIVFASYYLLNRLETRSRRRDRRTLG